MTPTPFEPFVAHITADPRLAEEGRIGRAAVTMFVDIAGFTSLSERLARCGTAGTEQLGVIIRRALGGAIDAVDNAGGDVLSFGGDAITVAFDTGDGAAEHRGDPWERARLAGEQIVEVVAGMNGEPTLIGRLELSVKIGIAAGRVTTTLCSRALRDVVAHLGPGLDAAVAAEERAAPGTIVTHRTDIDADQLTSAARHERDPALGRRTVPPLLASRLDEGLQPRDEHRPVTVVFVSLPAIDDRDPAALNAFAEVVSMAGRLLDELGGELVHCVGGDKGLVLFATFGAPVAHADDPARALHFVERLRSGTGVALRAGVSTGLTFVGLISGTRRAFLGLLGDTVNQGARLMHAATPGETLIEDRTRRAAGDSVTIADERLLSVKGKSTPLAVCRVASVTGQIGSFTVGDTPLVGREHETRRIVDLVARCQDGFGQLVHLEGVAGSGKTRVMGEVGRRLGLLGVRVEHGRFEGYGLGGSYGPFGRLAAVRLGLGPRPAASELETALERERPGEARVAPLVAEVLGIETVDNGFTAPMTPAERAELTRRTLVSLLRTTPDPTVLMLEDVHWADEASAAVLAGLAEASAESMLSVLCTRRPPELDQPRIPGTIVELGELGDEELSTIVRDTWSALGGSPLDDGRVGQIVERAAGSPLFAAVICELVRQAWSPGRPLPDVPLHEEMLGFLTERLDALPPDLGDLALRCAVFGRSVTAPELGAVFGLEVGAAESGLERLCTAGLLRSGTDGHVLRHATLGDALRERASHAERAPLHRAVAGWLMAHDRSPREIAGHLEQAGDAARHAAWIRAARDEAGRAWSTREAHRWAEVAVGSGDDPSDVLALSDLDLVLGYYAEARTRLEQLDPDDLPTSLRADRSRLLGKLELETGRLAEGVAHLRDAEQDGASGPELSWPMTMALCDLGRFEEAESRARDRLDDSDPRTRLDAWANLGVALFRRGNFDGSKIALVEASSLAESVGDLMRLIHATGDLAGVHFMEGELDESLELLERAAALAQRLGAHRAVTMALGNQAQVRLAAGDLSGSERASTAAAVAALQLPDPGLALLFLETPIVVAEARGDHGAARRWWLRHAELELRLGRRHEAALSTLRVATLLAQQGARVEADDRIDAARLLLADTDRSDDAELHLERARRAAPDHVDPPPEALEIAEGVELAPLDASIPEVGAEDIERLMDRIDGLVGTPASVTR